MTVKVPFFPVISKQLRILGSFRYGMGDYPLAISLVERGLIDLKPLVSQVVEFEDALEAFETTRKGRDANGKVCHSLQRRGSTDDAARHQMHHQRPQVGCGSRAKMSLSKIVDPDGPTVSSLVSSTLTVPLLLSIFFMHFLTHVTLLARDIRDS
jgi:hypothetical protein